jgi:hypothetical protein
MDDCRPSLGLGLLTIAGFEKARGSILPVSISGVSGVSHSSSGVLKEKRLSEDAGVGSVVDVICPEVLARGEEGRMFKGEDRALCCALYTSCGTICGLAAIAFV